MLHSLHGLGGPWLDSLQPLLYAKAHRWAQQSRCASPGLSREEGSPNARVLTQNHCQMCNWLWLFCRQAMEQINFNEFSNFTLCYISRAVCYLTLSNLLSMTKQPKVHPHCCVCDEVICGTGLFLGEFSCSDFSSWVCSTNMEIMTSNVDKWHFQSCVLRISNLVFVIYLSLNSYEGQ